MVKVGGSQRVEIDGLSLDQEFNLKLESVGTVEKKATTREVVQRTRP